jgi:protein-disulfide isomerase
MPGIAYKLALIFAFTCSWFAPAFAADAIPSQTADAILSELRQIRKLLDTRPPAPPVSRPLSAKIDVGSAPFVGSRDAPITVVEFTDYECPFCRRFQDETFPTLKAKYIDSGKVRFYVMDLPLDMHKNALPAAQAARGALEQGRFWPLHDKMQSNGQSLDAESLRDLARDLGLDSNGFQQCISSGRFKDAVRQSVSEAAAKGIRATPTFVVGRSTSAGVDGDIISGAMPLATFEKEFEEVLK